MTEMHATTTTTALPVRPEEIGRGAEGWYGSLERLFAIPEPYRSEVVDRHGALEMLRCGEQVLDELVARGLPCSGGRGEERFDRNDLFNLALYSGSGQSLPEIGFQFALRWMTAPSSGWFEDKRWTMSVELECGEPSCGENASWMIARPIPELFGGATESLALAPDGVSVGRATYESAGSGGLALSCEVETRGERLELLSPKLRGLVKEFMQARYRWIRMPEPLQRDYGAVMRHGVANCISASLHLEAECRAAGYEARTRRGWILGMLDLDHAWLEVVDDDGRVKVVDAVFALLSTHVPDANPDCEDVYMGSRINRLLPTEHLADQPLARHACGGSESVLRKRTVIRPIGLRAAPGGGGRFARS